MLRFFRRYQTLSVLLSAALFLSSCAQTKPDATDVAMNTSGFGGTGKQLDPTSGFGGTGKSSSGFGGTGIIGTITEFGSIWVNGVEIAYGDKTRISSNLKAQDRLKLGQQVQLQTEPRNDKTITRKIEVFYPIAGKVTHVSNQEIEVSGKYKVKVNRETLVDKGLKLSKGQYVAVNGYQLTDNKWVATRLNTNESEKTLYQPTPQFTNEGKVNRWIIETGAGQIKHYENQLQTGSAVMRNANSSQHVVIEVIRDRDGKAEIKSMMSYPEHIKMQERERHSFRPEKLGGDEDERKPFSQHRHDVNTGQEERDAADAMKMHQDGTLQNRDQLMEQRQQVEMQHEQQNTMHMQQEQKETFKEMQQQQREVQQQQREMQQQQREVQQQQREVQQQMETIREMSNPERD